MRTPLLTLVLALVALASLPAQPEYSAFLQNFQRAVEYGDEQGIDKAVRAAPDQAMHHFKLLLWDWKAKRDPAVRSSLDTLKASWKRVFDTSTLEDIERFILTRSDSERIALHKVESAELQVYELYWAGAEQDDRAKLEEARDGAIALAENYETLGQQLDAAKLWSLAAEIVLEFPDLTLEERREAIGYLRNFLSRREAWDWTEDSLYATNKNLVRVEEARVAEASAALAKRKEEGYQENVTGVDALVKPDAEETIHELEFEPLRRPYDDMFARGGESPGQWLVTLVEGKGPGKLVYFSARELYVVRPSTTEWGVSLRPLVEPKPGDYEPVEPSPGFEPSVFHLDAEKERPYAMWFVVGSARDPEEGLLQGMQRTDPLSSALVYYRSASSWTTEIAGEDVTFYDDNSNGKLFEEDPMAYGLRDATRDTAVPAFDSMKVGREDRQPLSRFVEIDGEWYHLRPHDDGTKVGVRPLNPEYFQTGEIELDWKGPRSAKPEVLVVSGEGVYSTAHFDIASGKAVEVPAGTWRLAFGRIETGKAPRGEQVHVYPGDMEPIRVEPGETTEVELGRPFIIDFEKKVVDGEVHIDALSLRVKGKAGEVYARSTEPPTPEVLVAKKPGRGGRPVGEFTTWTTDSYVKAAEKHPQLTIELLFFPMPKGDREGDTVLRAPLPFPDAVVGLQQKKHDIFGRLEPVWK